MSQTPSDLADGVPFSFFCSLLREISRAPSHKIASGHRYSKPDYPALNIFRRWTIKLKKDFSPLPPGTTAVIFKFLFPDEDHHRRFDMQETRLSQNITETFGIDKGYLENWLSENASGCLGEELRLVLERTSATPGGHISPLSITQVDQLLDELAATSGYTHESIRKSYPRNKRRARLQTIKDLFRTLSPIDASFLTQIILKDLRPILYPLRETHYIPSLLGHNASSVKILSKEDAMIVWDPSRWMLNSYRVKATFTEPVNAFERPPGARGQNVPKMGAPVAIPKSEKGRSPRHALQYFRNTQQIWAETKYDGERAQIHVEVQPEGTNITIFSKSRRDSTWDRIAVHETIYRALGLSRNGADGQSRVRANVIFDAEMVAFHGEKIDEFWRIKGLVEETAIGIRGRKHVPLESQVDSEACSHTSMDTDYSDMRRLGLVFFDILSFESKSLLMTPYRRRREILEGLIQVFPGECMLSQRVPVGVRGVDYEEESQIVALEKVFSESIAMYQEGLVLKGEETMYHDFSTPWVKLKKDYIPGYGDALDMTIVGVSWERERGRLLRVPPSTMTTFYIGGVENSEKIMHQPSLRPHLQVYFTVSYGLSRSQLEEINFLIRNSETIPYGPLMKTDKLDYTFAMLPGLPPPRFILKQPLLAELYGAGFTKAPKSRHYELRFPRVTKIHRPRDRPWIEGVNLVTLHKIACEAIGRDSSSKEAKDITAEMWGITASPGAKSALKRKVARELWMERLALVDRRDGDDVRPSESPPSESMEVIELPAPEIRKKPRTTVTQPSADKTSADKAASQPSATGRASTQALGTMTNVLRTVVPSGAPSQGSSIEILRTPLSTPQRLRKPDRKARSAVSIQEVPKCIALDVDGFFDNALVWFAKPRNEQWSVRSAVPWGQQIHSVEALLAGCGWCDATCATQWAEKGVVFMDESTVAGKELTRRALKMVSERMQVLPTGRSRKPLWFFDRNGWASGDRKVLHRFE